MLLVGQGEDSLAGAGDHLAALAVHLELEAHPALQNHPGLDRLRLLVGVEGLLPAAPRLAAGSAMTSSRRLKVEPKGRQRVLAPLVVCVHPEAGSSFTNLSHNVGSEVNHVRFKEPGKMASVIGEQATELET